MLVGKRLTKINQMEIKIKIYHKFCQINRGNGLAKFLDRITSIIIIFREGKMLFLVLTRILWKKQLKIWKRWESISRRIRKRGSTASTTTATFLIYERDKSLNRSWIVTNRVKTTTTGICLRETTHLCVKDQFHQSTKKILSLRRITTYQFLWSILLTKTPTFTRRPLIINTFIRCLSFLLREIGRVTS